MLHLDTAFSIKPTAALALNQFGLTAYCAKARRFGLMLTMTVLMALSFGTIAAAQSGVTAGYGDAKILFEQGKTFHDGDGVARDLSKARDFYLRAASGGNDFAQINLGYMAFVGEGTAQDYIASRKWYEQAANSGNYDAQRMMAVFYKNGLGVTANPAQADLWNDRAARGWKLLSAPEAVALKPAAPKTASPAPDINTAANENKIAATLPATNVVPAEVVTPPATAKLMPQTESTTVPKTVQAAPVPTAMNAESIALKPRVVLAAIAIAALIAFLAFVKIFGAISRARLGDDSQQFAQLFYNRNAQILKNSYHRASDPATGRGQVLATDLNDQWVISVSLMMIRFAQMQETLTGSRSATSESLIAALRDGPIEARRAALPLIPKIKAIIETGVEAEMPDVSGSISRTSKKLPAFNWPRFTAPIPGSMSPAE